MLGPELDIPGCAFQNQLKRQNQFVTPKNEWSRAVVVYVALWAIFTPKLQKMEKNFPEKHSYTSENGNF